jgi:hypothetical protein
VTLISPASEAAASRFLMSLNSIAPASGFVDDPRLSQLTNENVPEALPEPEEEEASNVMSAQEEAAAGAVRAMMGFTKSGSGSGSEAEGAGVGLSVASGGHTMLK